MYINQIVAERLVHKSSDDSIRSRQDEVKEAMRVPREVQRVYSDGSRIRYRHPFRINWKEIDTRKRHTCIYWGDNEEAAESEFRSDMKETGWRDTGYDVVSIYQLEESTDVNEAYIDDEHEFYDYRTGKITSPDDLIDTSKTGTSFYDQLIPGHQENNYMNTHKNLVGSIKYLSPTEYYRESSKLFSEKRGKDVTADALKSQRSYDEESNSKIKQVIQRFNTRLPLPYLNYAELEQEGLHRMMVLGDLYGWDKKFPVLIINWADEERHRKDLEQKRIREIEYKVERAIETSLQYHYSDLDEFKDQLQWELDKKFNEDNYPFKFKTTGDSFLVTVDNIEFQIDKDEVLIKEEESDEV